MRKLIHYISNFFYFAFNWNPVLAIFITWYDVTRERKYNIDTAHREKLGKNTVTLNDVLFSSPYEAVNYFILEDLLENFRRLYPGELSLVDVGCGKGRVLVAAAHFGFTRITGIDFIKKFCLQAEKNLEKIIAERCAEISIHCEHILNYHIKPGDRVFFLFNPFEAQVLEHFLNRIEESVVMHPRPVYFIYASPKYAGLLLSKGFEIVYRVKKLKYLEGLIAIRKQVQEPG